MAVYDSDFTFKGYLDPSFQQATGIDLSTSGQAVVGGYIQDIRRYDANGNLLATFNTPEIGFPWDVKLGAGGMLYIGAQDQTGTLGVVEREVNGMPSRNLGWSQISGVAILPGKILWSGGFGPSIEIFDLSRGADIDQITLDKGQVSAVNMFYSEETDTVLVSDWLGAGSSSAPQVAPSCAASTHRCPWTPSA